MSTVRVLIQTRGAARRFVICECGQSLAIFGLQDLDDHIRDWHSGSSDGEVAK